MGAAVLTFPKVEAVLALVPDLITDTAQLERGVNARVAVDFQDDAGLLELFESADSHIHPVTRPPE